MTQVDTGEIEVIDISLFNGKETTPTDTLDMHGIMRIGIRFKVNFDLPASVIVLGIHTPDLIQIVNTTSVMVPNYPDFEPGNHYLECCIEDIVLKPGSYSLSLVFFDRYARMIWYGQNLKNFKVIATHTDFSRLTQAGLIDVPFTWHFFDGVKQGDSCLNHKQS